LEVKCFRFSRCKTECMKYDFSATTQEEGNVRLDDQVATWDRYSKRIGISMKMLVIKLKSVV
jgi:hypothetical protein